jgi:hypothetical protein
MEGGMPALPRVARHSRALRFVVSIATSIADAFWRLAGGSASTVEPAKERAATREEPR